jgi:indole-3-glycerol phosphate synthase
MAGDILSRIIEYKIEEVNKLNQIKPESSLRAEAQFLPDRRPFIQRFEKKKTSDIRIIAEIKRASPSKGDIRPDLDVARFADAYERGGADAVSVLTESHWFKGSNDDLVLARNSTTLPVLRKDFIISTYQIYESAIIGTDAVLLIARILSKNQLKEFLDLSATLNLDALVEIHTDDDLDKINDTSARLIGINNRNLSSFETDIRRSKEMAAKISPHQIPVSLSGIKNRSDIEKTAEAGIYNFLIGESIVLSDNPEKFIRFLLSTGHEDSKGL